MENTFCCHNVGVGFSIYSLLVCKYKYKDNVRLSCLKCLSLITNLRYSSIHKYQKVVLKHLKSTLNDDKQQVRTKAVFCNNLWHLVGTQD